MNGTKQTSGLSDEKNNKMSLEIALKLLKIAHLCIKIKPGGPYSKGKHALTMENDQLMLIVNTGYEFKNLLLDEADLVKDPHDLIMEIKKIVEEKPINIRELN